MKRSDIKVGETYGVRLSTSDRASVVPATVVSIDTPVSWKERSYWGGDKVETVTKPTGGIAVKFVEPTRVGFREFSLASEANHHAGDIVEGYVFHPHRNGGAAQVSKMFVGLWDAIVAERKSAERARKERYADAKARAAEFGPKLDTYMARLAALGIEAELYDDKSGIHGDIDRTLSTERTAESYSSTRPTAFRWGDVRVDADLFEWLLQQAEATGATYDHKTYDDEVEE